MVHYTSIPPPKLVSGTVRGRVCRDLHSLLPVVQQPHVEGEPHEGERHRKQQGSHDKNLAPALLTQPAETADGQTLIEIHCSQSLHSQTEPRTTRSSSDPACHATCGGSSQHRVLFGRRSYAEPRGFAGESQFDISALQPNVCKKCTTADDAHWPVPSCLLCRSGGSRHTHFTTPLSTTT